MVGWRGEIGALVGDCGPVEESMESLRQRTGNKGPKGHAAMEGTR